MRAEGAGACCRCIGRTFNLAFHAWDEPIERTVAAARAAGIDLVTPRLGDVVDERYASTPWWKAIR